MFLCFFDFNSIGEGLVNLPDFLKKWFLFVAVFGVIATGIPLFVDIFRDNKE